MTDQHNETINKDNTNNDTDTFELADENKEFGIYVDILNIFQMWYNNNLCPSYPSMIEDTNDDTYTNGSLETFFEFMTDFKENINNLEMTRTYEIDDFIKNRYAEKYEEYYVLKLTDNNNRYNEYASPLMFSLLIFLSKIKWQHLKWDISIIEN